MQESTSQFKVNATRLDPYKTFKFRVKWSHKEGYIAGVSKVSALTRTTQVTEHREGGAPSFKHKSPGQTSFAAITLERGVTHDPEFEDWAKTIWDYGTSSSKEKELALKDFRRDITIELYNEAGQKVLAYNVYRCWVSEYKALPDLDANAANAVAIQSIKLENEGWERDTSVNEPTEPGA